MNEDDIDIFDPGNIPADMYRRDGSVKSPEGYLGPQTNKHDGKIMTELSIGVEIDGREVEIPAMVPTLTQSEIEILRNIRVGTDPIPRSIQQKAVDHAMPLLNSGKSPFFKGSAGGGGVSDIDIFDPQYTNPQLRGQHPSDSADLSALAIIPDMAKGFINDAYRYGKQAITGDARTDEELLARPELQGDAATISDMMGQGMDAAMNFRGLASTPERPLPSAVDVLGGALGMYQDVKPELIDIFGEPGVNKAEGTALLGSMILPGRVRQATKTGLYSQAAESALDLQRKSGNVQGYINDLTGKGKVKPDELRAIGFEDHFAGRNDIPRQEVQQYINDNQINLDETILRDGKHLPEYSPGGDPIYENVARNNTERAKYADYTLGGNAANNNYREILIQLPKGEDFYKGGHYPDVDNVAMTLRLNDRVDFDGKKGLLIEEIQDDWASAGNDLGYKDKANIDKAMDSLDELAVRKNELMAEVQELAESSFNSAEYRSNINTLLRDQIDELNLQRERLMSSKLMNLLPDRPFKSTDKSSDYNVAIKRALVEAANGDYDRLYLTTGQQQADRYDLSKSINEVRLGGNEADGFTVSAFDKNDQPVIMESIKSLDELPALIGKDAAKAIVDQPPTNTTPGFGTYYQKILAGQDLSIGGEGMKQFYDKTYRNALGKMVKPYGVKVGQSTLDPGPERFTEMFEEFQRLKHARDNNNFMSAADKKLLSKIEEEGLKPVDLGDTVYSVDITPKMREDFRKGIPMFAGGGAVDTTDIFEYNLGGSVSQMMRDPNEQRAAAPTGPQAASFAMNLPPLAGLTDAFGYMPQLPGSDAGYEDIFDQPNYPSMAANIGQGEYLDAGFQGLGVLGDLATAVPIVGPALGAAIKTPGALRKANKLSKAVNSAKAKPKVADSSKGIAQLIRQYDERFDPRVGEIDRLNNLNYDMVARAGTNNPDAMKLSDLEGEDFVTSMSDRTRAGGLILGIDGVPLYRGIDLRGGQGFMFENPNQLWASAEVPSRKILEMAEEMKLKSGKDPLFLPWRMAPTGGDFSSITGQLMLGFASANMNKTTKKALDAAIKKYKTKGSIKTDKKTGIKKRVNANLQIKGWKGVDDPSSVEIWKNTPDVVRKELMNMMDVSFRNQGGLSIGAARLINTDPLQVNAIDAGFQNVGRIASDQKITSSTHPAYPFAVPGEGIGSLPNADNATIFELLPDARFGDKQKKVVDAANPTAREIRALQMKPYGGTITEKILRRMEERGVNINSLTGLAPGALAFTLISGSLITPEEASAGGLDEIANELSSGEKDGLKKKLQMKKPAAKRRFNFDKRRLLELHPNDMSTAQLKRLRYYVNNDQDYSKAWRASTTNSSEKLGTPFRNGGQVNADLIDIFDV